MRLVPPPLVRLLTLVALAVVLLPVGAGPASAHASLVSSDPRDGARLERLPDEVTLVFTEEISPPAYVVVRAAGGADLTRGEPVVDGATVTQAVDPEAAARDGDVTIGYRVVSVDGHPVTGELGFAVAAPPAGDRSGGADPSRGAGGERPGEPEETAGTADGPTEQETAPVESAGFLADHGPHLVLGGFLVLVAGGLLWLARGRSTA